MIDIFGPTIPVTVGYDVDGQSFRGSTAKADAAFRARDLHGLPPTAAFEQHVTRLTKEVPTRWIGEQHVLEDFGRIPTVADFLRCMTTETWMVKGARPLSRELETTPVSSLETANEKEKQHV